MYSLALGAHSILRWLVILSGLAAAGRAVASWSARYWTPADDRAGLLFTITLDVQILVGLVLYFFLSPIMTSSLSNFGAAMSNDVARFWALEHPALMIGALAFAHIGRARSKRGPEPARRHRRAAVAYILALVAVLAAIPWPSLAYARPLVRLP